MPRRMWSSGSSLCVSTDAAAPSRGRPSISGSELPPMDDVFLREGFLSNRGNSLGGIFVSNGRSASSSASCWAHCTVPRRVLLILGGAGSAAAVASGAPAGGLGTPGSGGLDAISWVAALGSAAGERSEAEPDGDSSARRRAEFFESAPLPPLSGCGGGEVNEAGGCAMKRSSLPLGGVVV